MVMCVQNDMLTIRGDADVSRRTHPKRLPKTLTSPDLRRFGPIQMCRGMRQLHTFSPVPDTCATCSRIGSPFDLS
ncbi:hypothetical protein BVI434_850018 [Burkholderia vietnamiensis]|nr:hypothetical protein BVI434_850018 [Burkholderia vietnamiensis]